jgi:hypothetical protein
MSSNSRESSHAIRKFSDDFLMACEKGQIKCLKHMKESSLMKIMTKKKRQQAVLRAVKGQVGQVGQQVEVLKFLHSTSCFDKSHLTDDAIIEACKNGYLDVLKCFRETYKLESDDLTLECYITAFKYACFKDLEFVKYLHNNFGVTKEIDMMHHWKMLV